MPFASRIHAAACAAICVAAVAPGHARTKSGHADPPPKARAADAAGETRASTDPLARKLQSAQEALDRLGRDSRRRKYRDGWEAIARDLDAAARGAPKSPLAAEAELLAAKARESLWSVSRARVDARAAIACYRQVEQRHEGREAGQRALVAAIRLAHQVGEKKEASACARRLAAYPRGSEVREALALAGAGEPAAKADARPARAEPARTGVAAALDQARPATADDRAARKPVAADGEDEAGSAAAPPAAPAGGAVAARKQGAAPALSPARAARAGRDAPPSPEREPDTDVPAEAARVLDALVHAVRAKGADDLLGEKAPAAAPVPAGLAGHDVPPAAGKDAAAAGGDGPAVSPAGAAKDVIAADDGPPEPEEAEELPAPRHTRASAPRSFPAEEQDPDAERKARELRTALLGGSASVAAQLGLKVRTIAIDAGHGGRDTGAIGPKGLREKDATLAIARKVAARLKALGFTVVMTRDSDAYVGLGDRTRIANEAGADLFVSIHCNAARKRGLSGVETWTLNVASDRYSQRLAAFENAEADATVGNLRLILADLATKANASDARELAGSVQSSLVRTLRSRLGRVKDHGVKHALFYVLLGAHMPSILVETAFLSNPEEEKRLRSAKYQDASADAISRGVKEYLDSRRRLARAL